MTSTLVLLSAADDAALAAEAGRLVAFLDRVPAVPLLDVAYTCALAHGPATLGLVVTSVADLRARLSSAKTRLESGLVARIRDKSGSYWFRDRLLGANGGRLAFLFPGVMGFYPDMMRDLAISFAPCREPFDELEEAFAGNPDFTPSNFIFPPAPQYRRDADIFSSGAYAEALVATYAGCSAMARMLAGFGVTPSAVAGFAGGDLAALVCAGETGRARTRRNDRIRLLRDIYGLVHRGLEHAGLPKTVVLSLLLRHEGEADETLARFTREQAVLAIDVSPRQKIYAVDPAAADEFRAAFAAAGIRVMPLSLDRPFNTDRCERLVPAIRKFTDTWVSDAPSCDAYSCATAEPVPARVRKARAEIAARWAAPVRFRETIRRMYDDGCRVFLEVGPRGLLTAAVADTLKGEPHAAIATNSIHRRGLQQLEHALAELAAQGAALDISKAYAWLGARKLDFDATPSLEVRRESELRLSRTFPHLTLLSDEPLFGGDSPLGEPKGRGAKVAARQAAIAAQERRTRQFEAGALNPLVSDADVLDLTPGVSIELRKTFRLADAPFVADFAIGVSQLSYSDPNLRGLVLLTVPVAAEIMAEVAAMLVPNRTLVAVEDFALRRFVAFRRGALTLCVRAERAAAADTAHAAVKVQVRDDAPASTYTLPIAEATFVLARESPALRPVVTEPLSHPRTVHWSGRDIYPLRICCGRRLRNIVFAEQWSETGLDYEIEGPSAAGQILFTRFPIWQVDPVFLDAVTSGFHLWRSHERFAGAFSFPVRFRRLDLHAPRPREGARARCYLRLTGVTPTSQLCDIAVSDGNGSALATLSGWEELADRVPPSYRELVLQPAVTFLTRPISSDILGRPLFDASTALITDIPYPLFAKDGELWLSIFSHIVLSSSERRTFETLSGSAARRTEWLFGRIAAKEAVRRYMKDYHQARWSDADVTVNPDPYGKPVAIGAWQDYLSSRLDITIAHTSQFVIALAAANARVGVDVESSQRDLSAEFVDGVFTPEEKLLADADGAGHAYLRFWCAKEAVSKALGVGIRFSPKELTVVAFDAPTGQLSMRLKGAWETAFPKMKGRDLAVTVRTVRDHALGFCFLPRALFEEGETPGA